MTVPWILWQELEFLTPSLGCKHEWEGRAKQMRVKMEVHCYTRSSRPFWIIFLTYMTIEEYIPCFQTTSPNRLFCSFWDSITVLGLPWQFVHLFQSCWSHGPLLGMEWRCPGAILPVAPRTATLPADEKVVRVWLGIMRWPIMSLGLPYPRWISSYHWRLWFDEEIWGTLTFFSDPPLIVGIPMYYHIVVLNE